MIGMVDNIDDDPIVISNPMTITTFPTEDGIGMGLRNSVILSEEDYLIISKRNVLTFYTPKSILKEYYNEIISSMTEVSEDSDQQIRDALHYEKMRKQNKLLLEKKAELQVELQVKEWLRSSNTTYH